MMLISNFYITCVAIYVHHMVYIASMGKNWFSDNKKIAGKNIAETMLTHHSTFIVNLRHSRLLSAVTEQRNQWK